MSQTIRCAFRENVRQRQGAEIATCRLLQQITELDSDQSCTVRRDACEACSESFSPSSSEINPIIASLLYQLSEEIISQRGKKGHPSTKAAGLQHWAKQNLECADEHSDVLWVSLPKKRHLRRTPTCDVILCCEDASEKTNRAARSILGQQGVEAILHLIDNGGGGKDLILRYQDHPKVVIHFQRIRLGLFETLHELVPYLRSEFVAVQDTRTISYPDRLRDSVALLTEHGGDLFASALQCPNEIILPREPGDDFQRYVPSSTLVFRRASLVDMGGIADRQEGVDAELVYRAGLEQRRILLSRRPTVRCSSKWVQSPIGPAPSYRFREGLLGHHAKGFPEETVACDVVLPFHGHLDYLQEAIQSSLDQEGAEPVIHLVDDASSEDTHSVLRYWGTHRRVRTYRNERNLGQFISFNNVFPYFETTFVAVQDGDDISLPHRIHRAGNALRLVDADIFGARLRKFGDEWAKPETRSYPRRRASLHSRDRYLSSRFPAEEQGHFLLNATAVMRVSAFETLGGFTDFGELRRNCCAADTEFYLRACYSGLRFAVSQDVLIRYRCHPDSATHNPLTRSGSPPRDWTEAECRRRAALFQQRPFDPRAFGSLRNWRGFTRRLSRK